MSLQRRVKYTIESYDSSARRIAVSFNDGSSANIQLTDPLPVDKEDLEEIIEKYTIPLELLAAKVPTGDLSFIEEMVGVEGEIDRNITSATNPTSNMVLRQYSANQTVENPNGLKVKLLLELLNSVIPAEDTTGAFADLIKYRSELSDLTHLPGWPNVTNFTWPTPPYEKKTADEAE